MFYTIFTFRWRYLQSRRFIRFFLKKTTILSIFPMNRRSTCRQSLFAIYSTRDVSSEACVAVSLSTCIKILKNHLKCVRIHIHLVNKHVLFQNSIGKTLIWMTEETAVQTRHSLVAQSTTCKQLLWAIDAVLRAASITTGQRPGPMLYRQNNL